VSTHLRCGGRRTRSVVCVGEYALAWLLMGAGRGDPATLRPSRLSRSIEARMALGSWGLRAITPIGDGSRGMEVFMACESPCSANKYAKNLVTACCVEAGMATASGRAEGIACHAWPCPGLPSHQESPIDPARQRRLAHRRCWKRERNGRRMLVAVGSGAFVRPAPWSITRACGR
jgi:hypothetical protein